MRNLKRALSLALASVMLLGMMVVGSGASYADVTSEQNQEAIEVLQAVGVMVGDESGNFNPDKNVTRNEMAVIMANLMDYRVATYAGTSPFTDVPSWAEPYVAACWTNGITSGTSATTYGGDSTVTTAQAALMLMKALGYFQFGSDFGSDWQLATVAQANKIDLLNGVEAGVREAMTRNDVAQLVLNTLKSGMVEADDDTIKIDADGVTVEAGKVNYLYVTSRESYARAIKQDQSASANSVNNLSAPIVDLGEKLYQGDLVLREGERDSFGRPADTWRYKTNDIGTYADEAIATYTTKVTKDELWSLIGRSNVNALGTAANSNPKLSVYTDGADTTVRVDGKAAFFQSNSTGAAGDAGKGVKTEVYMDNDGNVTLVYVNTYLAQVNGDFNEKKGTLNTVTLTGPVGYNVGTLDVQDFENLADFKDEDYILYTVSANGSTWAVESIAKAQVVTGKVEAYSHTNSVTLDGTKYDYAAKIEGSQNDPVTDSADTKYNVGANASVVLDQYGYVLYVDDAALSVGSYVYINGMVKPDGLGDTYKAEAFFYDGTMKTITVEKIYNAAGTEIAGPASSSRDESLNGWYSFSITDDEYTLKAASTNVERNLAGSGAAQDLLQNNKVRFLTSNSTIAGDNDTIFLVYDGDELTAYTGIKNLPDVSFTATANANDKVDVYYMKDKDDSTNAYASLVAIVVKEDSTGADATTDITVNGGSQETMLYVLNQDSTYVNKANGETIEVWNVILDGEVKTIETKENSGLSAYGMFYRVKQDSNGYYKAVGFPAGGSGTRYANHTLSGDAVEYSNGTVTLGNRVYTVTDDTKIVLVFQDVTGTGAKNNGNTMNANNVMVDAAAKYETYVNINGKTLENLVRGYTVDGKFYGVCTDTTGLQLQSLYVVVTDVH